MRKNIFKNVLSTITLTGLLFGISTPVMATPSSIIYQNISSQFVSCNYLDALSNAPMKTALSSALSSNEVANLPIFVTDSNGKVIDYLAAINKNENYATALLDSTVNNAIAQVANYQMNTDGNVTPVETAPNFPLPLPTCGTMEVIYQNAAGNYVSVNYLNALSHAPMKTAFISALSTNEVANLPIFIIYNNGQCINFEAAISNNGGYWTFCTPPTPTYVMNLDGTVTQIAPG